MRPRRPGLLALSLLLLAAPSGALPGEGLLPGLANAGFELCTEDDGAAPCAPDTGAFPDAWIRLPPWPGEAFTTWTTAEHHTGLAAVRMVDPAWSTWTGLRSQLLPLPEAAQGLPFEAKAWVKASGPGMYVGLYVAVFDAGGATVAYPYMMFYAPTEWTEMVVPVTIPPGAASLEVVLYSSIPYATGEWFADDVTLLPVLPALT